MLEGIEPQVRQLGGVLMAEDPDDSAILFHSDNFLETGLFFCALMVFLQGSHRHPFVLYQILYTADRGLRP